MHALTTPKFRDSCKWRLHQTIYASTLDPIFSKCHFPASLRVLELCWSKYKPKSLMLALAEQAPQLEVLTITSYLDAAGCAILPRLKQLTYLIVNLEYYTSELFLSSIRTMPSLRGVSLANLTMREETGMEHHNAFTKGQAWQLVSQVLEAVPQLEHFSTPRLSYGHWRLSEPAMRRLAAMKKLRSLELLVGMPWEEFARVFPGVVENVKLEVSHGHSWSLHFSLSCLCSNFTPPSTCA